MTRRGPMVAILMVLAAGCSTALDTVEGDDVTILDAAAVEDQGVIVGDLDWQEAAGLAAGPVRTASRAAGYLSIPARGSRCSGFLISRDVVMTNQHCVPNAESAVGLVVNFTYETRWDTTGVFRCDELIGNSRDLDYALLRCQGAPGDRFGFLSLEERVLGENDPVALLHQQCQFIGNPECLPTKKVSPGKILGRGGNRILHDADMLGGSSGGGIIDPSTGAVVAINNASVMRNTRPGGYGEANVGVPMTHIVPDLVSRFPGIVAQSCARIPASGRDIDEDDGCATLGGQARYWRAVEGQGGDGDLAWTGTTAASAPGNFARWRLDVQTAGRYALSVYVDAPTASASRARYTVTHATGTTAVILNQGAVASSGFVSLGEFELAPGRAQGVRVDDNTGDRGEQLVVDTLRVRPAGAAPPPAPAPTPPPATTSCGQVEIVNATTLNVRPTPDTSGTPRGTLSGGDVVARLATVTGAEVRGTTQWYEIDASGLRGFISAGYARCVD